jgi:hypothetical protein
MPLKIENLTTGVVLLRYRSGRTEHIAGGATTEELPDSEVRSNPRILRLAERQIVAVHDVTQREARPSRGRQRRARPDSA